jgi:hypothetical protein
MPSSCSSAIPLTEGCSDRYKSLLTLYRFSSEVDSIFTAQEAGLSSSTKEDVVVIKRTIAIVILII